MQTLSASLEDYIEAIFHIINEKQAARAKDISRRLKVSMSSVTGALRSLAEKKLINYTPYDSITLTPEGKTAARDVVRRHEVLRDFLVKVLAVDEAEADNAACRMEHSIPRALLERFIQFAEFVELCPRGGAKWISGFGYYCDHGGVREDCERCIASALEDLREKKTLEESAKSAPKTLRDLKPGQKAKVVRIKSKGEANKRIVEMGVTPGALIEVERIAPLGDPIDINIRGYHLSLRKEEAEGIEIEVI